MEVKVKRLLELITDKLNKLVNNIKRLSTNSKPSYCVYLFLFGEPNDIAQEARLMSTA